MSQQYEWLVRITDKPDTSQARINTTAEHIKNLKSNVQAGRIAFSGPTLAVQPKAPEEKLIITGSILMVQIGSEEELLSMLHEDPLAKAGVWDLESVVITPFRCGVRTPM